MTPPTPTETDTDTHSPAQQQSSAPAATARQRPGEGDPPAAAQVDSAPHRWPPALTFVLVVVGLLVALRLVHLALPLLYPPVLSGPFSVDDVGQAETYTGFAPRVPFYRPEVLGTAPVYVTARRRPHPQVTIFWQGDRFLYLSERRGGPRPFVRPEAKPLPGRPDSSQWREGRTWRVVLQLDDLWVELRTDLPEQDLHRLVDTLRPYGELR